MNQYQQPLAGLASDTALRETPEGFEATLNPDWETIGPCGGYLAAIALRAAGQHAGRPRPVSISCAFLRPGTAGPAEVCVRTLTRTRRACSVDVCLSQDAKVLMKALVWMVSGDLTGPAHDAAPMPSVTPPEELRELDTLLPPGYTRPFASWRKGVEERTLTYDFGGCRRPLGEPRVLSWFRFRPVAAFDDPFTDAGRSLLLIDTMPFPAASAAYREIPPYFAQSLDLTVHFHRAVPGQEWLLCEATAPVAGEGILSGRTRIWGRDGALLASGSQQLILSKFPATISNPLSRTDRAVSPRHHPPSRWTALSLLMSSTSPRKVAARSRTQRGSNRSAAYLTMTCRPSCLVGPSRNSRSNRCATPSGGAIGVMSSPSIVRLSDSLASIWNTTSCGRPGSPANRCAGSSWHGSS